MFQLTHDEGVENGSTVQSVPLNPRAKLSYQERQAFLARSHVLYAKNQHVKFEGKWLHFEPPAIHLGLAALFHKRSQS